MHDAWLTGECAVRRHMVRVSPKCPLCGIFNYTKLHVMTQCTKNNLERKKVIETISKTNKYNRNQILYLDIECNKNTRVSIVDYIVSTIRACGINFIIERNFR